MGTSLPTCSRQKAHATEVQIHIVFYQTLPFVNLIPNRNLQNYYGSGVNMRFIPHRTGVGKDVRKLEFSSHFHFFKCKFIDFYFIDFFLPLLEI